MCLTNEHLMDSNTNLTSHHVQKPGYVIYWVLVWLTIVKKLRPGHWGGPGGGQGAPFWKLQTHTSYGNPPPAGRQYPFTNPIPL